MAHSTSKKKALLAEATRLFSEHGFWDTSINDIAKATGVADGTIFYHFSSKEALFIAVLKNFKENLIGRFNQHLAEQSFSNGLEMVEAAIHFYLDQTKRSQGRFLLLHRHHYYQIADENPKCWQQLEETYSGLISIFELAIVRGQQDHSIGNVSARNKAQLLFTLVDGLVRLDSYNLFQANSLHDELIDSCRSILKPTPH